CSAASRALYFAYDARGALIMGEELQKINIFLDDSGIFSRDHTDDYFIYAGYVFCTVEDRQEANRRYRTLSDTIRRGIGHAGELKASILTDPQNKRALVKVLKRYESIACVIHIPRVQKSIMGNKLSRHRYKDYAIKIAVKRKLEK